MKKSKIPRLVEVMTPFPYSIDATASLQDAKQLMQKHNIHHLPVKIEDVIESVISDRDLKFASLPGSRDASSELQVGDFCAQRAYCADINDPLDQVLDAMVETHIGAVLVFKEGKLAGIFTNNDGLRSYSRFLKESKTTEQGPSAA